MSDYIIEQLSIFVSNEPGALAKVSRTLGECGISMKACNLAESNEFGILRAIVEDPDGAIAKLKAAGIVVKKTQIIGVAINDDPGSMYESTNALGKAGINIEYGYAFVGKQGPALLMKTDDPVRSAEVLGKAGLRVLRAGDL
ncbi:MAG: amino acid-binding protein [Candidatus Methanomethylophilus sp.]|jgi:hypothetical protein|nr:amino acid-binding protein [Methanomethylophilus sp.]MCI2074323.1 amino acid-binding protein [Methanomethylophilus sp.]MCI2092880.1 amino acid-binding protein [Methanomethylophilus sp.]MEE3400677.1 amino acid-binding protein [Methanomethylophilus sp.]